MTLSNGFRSFAKSVAIGVLIASIVPAICMGVAMLLSDGGIGGAIGIAAITFVFAFIISTVFVLFGAILIGLPTTAILSRLKWESELSYVAIAALAGLILPLVAGAFVDADAMYVVAFIMGPIAGALMGRAWWRSYRIHVVQIEEV